MSFSHNCMFGEFFLLKIINNSLLGQSAGLFHYRLIIILFSISEMFVRIMYNHFINYFKINYLFNKYQYGYLKDHSTTHAAIKLLYGIK